MQALEVRWKKNNNIALPSNKVHSFLESRVFLTQLRNGIFVVSNDQGMMQNLTCKSSDV